MRSFDNVSLRHDDDDDDDEGDKTVFCVCAIFLSFPLLLLFVVVLLVGRVVRGAFLRRMVIFTTSSGTLGRGGMSFSLISMDMSTSRMSPVVVSSWLFN